MAKKVLDRFGSETELIAQNVEFNNLTNGFIATDVQGAIEEAAQSANAVQLSAQPDGFDLVKADTTTDQVRFNLIDDTTPNPKLEIVVKGVVVKTVPLNQNDIQINNAGSDFDLTDDVLSFVETNGDTATINFSKYNVTAATLPNGDITISQNGNLLTTIKQSASGISFDNLISGTTYTTVQEALDACLLRKPLQEDFVVSTTGQTGFTVINQPLIDAQNINQHITFVRNGVTLRKSAFSVTGNSVNYNPAGNSNAQLQAGDDISIIYFRGL